MGYIDLSGRVVIPARYEIAYEFKGDYAVVATSAAEFSGEWAVIDRTGRVVIPPSNALPRRYSDGVWYVEYGAVYRYGGSTIWSGDENGYMDKTGKRLFENKFKGQLLYFSHGKAEVYIDGKWGYIDKKGTMAIPAIYDVAMSFYEGLAGVRSKDKWGYLDEKGLMVIPAIYDNAKNFQEGLACVRSEKKWGFIDRKGQWVIPPQFDRCYGFKDGRAYVFIGKRSGFIDRTGKLVAGLVTLPEKYWHASEIQEDMAQLQLPEKDSDGDGLLDDDYVARYGFINMATGFVIEPVYELVGDFNEGLAPVYNEKGCGFIDKTGKLVVPMRYDSPSPIYDDIPLSEVLYFSQGLCAVRYKGKIGFIDKTAKFVIEPQFKEGKQFHGPLAFVVTEKHVGYINRSGKYVWKTPISETVSKDPLRGH